MTTEEQMQYDLFVMRMERGIEDFFGMDCTDKEWVLINEEIEETMTPHELNGAWEKLQMREAAITVEFMERWLSETKERMSTW